jgi:hypothetical protein
MNTDETTEEVQTKGSRPSKRGCPPFLFKEFAVKIATISWSALILFCVAEMAQDRAAAAEQDREGRTSNESRSADDGAIQLLNNSLPNLAKMQGLDPQDFLTYRRDGMTAVLHPQDGHVDVIHVLDERLALAIQTIEVFGVPGSSGQQLVLLSLKGKILDRIQCDINSRYGTVRTEILPKPDSGGACAVIRFVGMGMAPGKGKWHNWWHNWHTIVFHDKFWTFTENEKDAGPHSLWNEQGLCRIGIANDKFVVLFPKLQMPDVKKAKTLRIVYYFDSLSKKNTVEKKLLEITDPIQVSNLLATINIKGEDDSLSCEVYGGGYYDSSTSPTVEFVMSDGTQSRWRFLARDRLSYIKEPGKAAIPGAGTIHLTSGAFRDALSTIVSKAEGRPIDL